MANVTPKMIAYCYADGQILIGLHLPEDATWLARGDNTLLRAALAKHAKCNDATLTMLVPGVDGATDEAAWDAVSAFRYRMYRSLRRSNIKGEQLGIDTEGVLRRSYDLIQAGDISGAGWLLHTALQDVTQQLQRSPAL